MPLNVKQIVTVGLGLGVATAFGYHFLTTSQDDASRQTERTMQPLGEFHVAPIVSQPPPAFHDHETGVKPLSRRMHGDVVLAPTPTLQNKTSDYQKLVDSFEESKLVRNDDLPAAINPETTLPPVQPIVQAASNSDTDELNSLQISAPSIDNFDNSEFEFSLDDQPSQPVASTPPTLELVDGTVSETNATAEIENAPAFETPSIADAPIDGSETEDDVAEIDPAQLKSIDPTNDMLVVTSPYFSPTTDPRTTAHQDSVQRPKNWQANPFLDAQSSLEINDAIVATPIQNDLSLPEDGPTEFSDAETAELQRSIISLYDPMHEAIEAQAAQREANRPAANASIAVRSRSQTMGSTSISVVALIEAPPRSSTKKLMTRKTS